MKSYIYLLFACFIFSSNAFANEIKEDTVLFSIGGDEVTLEEFRYVYEKSNLKKDEAYTKKSLEEYLELYVNFKLKVKEAETLKYDTIPAVQAELDKYNKQLAKSYLNEKEITSQLIKEAYDRLAYDIKASHILIKCDEKADPEDTIAAYNKALQARKRVTKKKEKFTEVAIDLSDDPSVRKNHGDLGYFTALQMVYPFENAAFNTEKGEVSNVFRTRFGYHILKVEDKRPSLGKVHVAHIFAKIPKGANDAAKQAAKAKIQSVHAKILEGENYETLAARFSDDKGSAQKGGVIRWFGAGEMVKEFEDAAFALKADGEISEPILSPYGYHIIKRIEHKGLEPLADMEKDLKKKIKRDSRSNVAQQFLIERIKKDYSFTENNETKEALFALIDSTILKSKWAPDSTADLSGEIFKIGERSYTAKEFSDYIIKLRKVKRDISLRMLFEHYYEGYVETACIKYEESKLGEKYPEFKALMQEYNDGILLFEITDDMVWNKAVEDSTGLVSFYETIKNDYMWEQRMESSIYTCKDSATAAAVKKYLVKKKVKPSEWLLKKFNTEENSTALNIEKGKFESGENKFVEDTKWSFGLGGEQTLENGQVVMVVNHNKIEPMPKALDENRGQAISEYQGHLEKTWIASLKEKYKVVVNENVFNGLIQ